ncbi:hypothetical protein COV49_01035 [Candidatus Falkowbacteria bacterium CG11_big_fil_rev_8_21_14_0_20_39_10]|uniref:DUF1648 domain-containing protein n=1 Tax=Candidatus Falkowbacteria bacterium CG11_big_fil_rev_8_21_14_0_20_39_10 TaxID=1974570 RepID=A0A2M6K9N0_9BACT|nr:MAG: hypothetical protein COV49_01035 [Candidatus Falkowbacteria bacterium CG11_big_fil_rev_8_21_14_0_20_39_10]
MNPIKPTIKTELPPIILILVTFLSSFYFYARFPEQVPTHWNMAGQVDDYSPRAFAAFFFPALALFMYILFLILPHLDPRKERYAQFKRIYHIFKTLIVAMMALIYFIVGFSGLGYNISVSLWMPVLIGLLFIVMGNYLSKIKPNWFMGIRTPWTLSSEEVWNKTHRFGGKIFILGGLLMILEPLLPTNFQLAVFIITMVIILAGTVGYSLIAYLQEKKNK